MTLREVAHAASVHISTASRALDPANAWRIGDETIARVQEAAASLGYRPDLVARGLKHGKSLSVGVVVADLENPFVGPVVRGIVNALEARDYVALVTETFDDPARFVRVVDRLVGRRVDAIITTSTRLTNRALLEGLAARGTPVVLAVRSLARSRLPSVSHDDVAGAALAVEHLASLGHRAIAQIVGPQGIQSFVDRARSFTARAATLGLTDVTIGEEAERTTPQAGREAMTRLLAEARVRPTAIFAPNDLLAIGAIDAAASHGLRCPEHLSVVGYNDAPLADHLSPPLTTIRIPGEEIGRIAGETALAVIDEPNRRFKPVTLGAELIVRGSSGPPPE